MEFIFGLIEIYARRRRNVNAKKYQTLLRQRADLMRRAEREYHTRRDILIGETAAWPQIEAIDKQLREIACYSCRA